MPPACGRKRGKPGADAAIGRTIYPDTLSWRIENGGASAQPGSCGERQAGQAFAAEDGAGGGVPETQHQPAEPGT